MKFLAQNFFCKYKKEIIIFFVALFVRLFVLGILVWWGGQIGGIGQGSVHSFPVMGDDSSNYAVLAKNILSRGVFSSFPSAPYLAEGFRVPGYPIFIALILALGKSFFAVSIVQDILAALSVVLFYRIASMFLGQKFSFVATGLFIIEPSGLFFSNLIFSETLFIFLLLLCFYVFLDQRENPAFLKFALSGLILGVATYVRVIALLLPIFFCAMAISLYWRKPYKSILGLIAVFILCFGVVLAPWAYRNHKIFDSWSLSSTGTYNFYYYYVSRYYAKINNISQVQADKILREKSGNQNDSNYYYQSLYNSSTLKKSTGVILKGHELDFYRFYLVKASSLFFTDGLRDIARTTKLIPDSKLRVSNLLLQGRVGEIAKLILHGEMDLKLFLVGFIFWSLIFIFMLFGALVRSIWLRDRSSVYHLFFFLVVCYFIFAAGPEADARMRISAVPLMILLALVGVELIYGKIKHGLTHAF